MRYMSLGTFGTIIVLSSVSLAEETPRHEADKKKAFDDTGRFDYSVPDSPALAISGLSITKTLRPQTPKGLVTDVRAALDDNGKLKEALSVAGIPYLIFGAESGALDEYNKKGLQRALANIELSIVAAKGETEKDFNRYSAGIRWNIYDRGDPREVSTPCLVEATARIVKDAPNPADGAGYSKYIREQGQKELQACYDKWSATYWNAHAMDVGFALSHADPNSAAPKDLDKTSYGLYWMWSYGIGTAAQIVFNARYVFNELTLDKSDAFFNQDRGFVGARVRYRVPNNDRIYLNIEGGYLRTSPKNSDADTYAQYTTAIEYKLTDGYWLNLSFGGRTGADREKNDGFVLGALKWNISDMFSGK